MARPRNQGGVDPVVQAVMNETKAGRDEHDLRVGRYGRSYKTYRGLMSRPTGAQPWQSRLRPKYALQNLDTAMVNMAQGKPRCKVLPRLPGYEANARGFQLVMDYHTGKDHLAEKAPITIQQALIYGIHIGKVPWLYKTTTRPAKTYDRDPYTGEAVPVAALEEVVLRDGPSYEPWDVYDAWWEPNARSVDDADWFALRSWLTKEYLLEHQCTTRGRHDPHECTGLYHNVEELLRLGIAERRSATAQEQALGGDGNLKKDRFEVVEYWRDSRLTVIGNSQVLLRDAPNPYWHGKKPIVAACSRPDLFKLQGIPETELVSDFQEALWTLKNMRFDNLHLTVMRGFTYREGGITDPNALNLMPRFKWGVTDHDDVKMVEIQPLPPEAYNEEEVLLAGMRDVTGISPYISGAGTEQIDQNTATGISILNSAATALLRFKAQQIHNGVWQRTFEQWGDLIQQFMDKPQWVRLVGPGGEADWVEVGPDEVVGDYEYVLEGTEESLSRQQERQEAISLLTAFAPLAQTGLVNFKPLLEKVARAFGFPNPEELFTGMQGVPPAAPFPPGTPPNGNGAGQSLVNGGPMPMNVQQAVGQM